MLIELMPTYMDIFRHLQSHSKFYPLVGAKEVMIHLIDKLESINKERLLSDAIYTILTETCI